MPSEDKELPPEFTLEEYNAVLPRVIELMVSLGWITPESKFATPITLKFTREGEVARKLTRSLLLALSHENEQGTMMSAFHQLIVISPAGQETN